MYKPSRTVVSCLLVAAFFNSVASFATTNPFVRPEIKIIEEPIYTNNPEPIPVIENPYENNMSLEVPMVVEKMVGHKNPLLNKDSVIFKGSINGVDIYFDNSTGQYIDDKSSLEKVELLTSSLPALDKVNY